MGCCNSVTESKFLQIDSFLFLTPGLNEIVQNTLSARTSSMPFDSVNIDYILVVSFLSGSNKSVLDCIAPGEPESDAAVRMAGYKNPSVQKKAHV